MPKKFGQNQKSVAGRERKAANEQEKKSKKQAEQEAKEAAEWSKGAKKAGKKEQTEAKRAQQLAKKAELAALEEADNAMLSKMKKAPASQSKLKQEEKRNTRNVQKLEKKGKAPEVVPSLTAENLDDALDLLSVVDDTETKPGSRDAPDRHPERRMRAAYAAFSEREMPRVKKENPGLRLTQLQQVLWKEWQKSPENPFNQATLAFNASVADERELIQQRRREIEERLQD
ncbi:hypothetical protein THASP1DRAFT_27628 [Thamnocephalis sphaerospora]|uniref:HMG box domain-containing protein n=1 Tax=Thamnocephalis sphaerospora TaxID=78915 RepID=A0A4P9XW76_9FUNG|nr:hypothetical protein THASP1DRAFT_27628 [Thamnocephalis sphaerospora]|eukprot:RKP10573.1 hypothetical protein THASP1DRAFT_27628 [Thamnocephalis sphaerospora]